MTAAPSPTPARTYLSAPAARQRLVEELIIATGAVRDLTGHQPTIRHLEAVYASSPTLGRLRETLAEVASFLRVEVGLDPQTREVPHPVKVIRAALEETRQPLRCPDCGDTIDAACVEGSSQPAVLCNNRGCFGSWDEAGEVL